MNSTVCVHAIRWNKVIRAVAMDCVAKLDMGHGAPSLTSSSMRKCVQWNKENGYRTGCMHADGLAYNRHPLHNVVAGPNPNT